MAKAKKGDSEIIASIDGFKEVHNISKVLSQLGDRGYVYHATARFVRIVALSLT